MKPNSNAYTTLASCWERCGNYARRQRPSICWLLVVFLVIGAPSPGSAAQVPQSPCTSPLQCLALPLTHKGRFIVDANGEIHIFHGANMVDKFPPYNPAVLGFGPKDAAILKHAGINLVRLGIIYSAVEPAPGIYNERYLDHIAATVALLRRHGIFSLLDFHQDNFGPVFTGEGFPRWATQTDKLPTLPNYGFPKDYLKMKAVQHAFDHFWSDSAAPDGIGLQEHYIEAWRHVAARFKNNPGVLGYDLFNEPFPGTDWESCASKKGCQNQDQSVLGPFMAKTAKAIEAIDPNHLVFYEPWIFFDFGAPTFEPSPGGPQSGMSFHDYLKKNLELPIQNALGQSSKTGDALLLTEFGASTSPTPATEVANLADNAMLSWCYWAYANNTPFQINSFPGVPATPEQQGIVLDLSLPRIGKNVNWPVLKAISRPYPKVIAGTPTSFAFDPTTDEFKLVYAAAGNPNPNDDETYIVVPAAQYPKGYRSSVTGGTVVSQPNAPVLEIATVPNSREMVSVTIDQP